MPGSRCLSILKHPGGGLPCREHDSSGVFPGLHRRFLLAAFLAPCLAAGAGAEERAESFDVDPGWERHNNRSDVPPPRHVRQDFGYAPSHLAGGKAAGEMGGFITPAAEPAYYARRIARRTLEDGLTASGTLNATGRQFHVLLGFFNSGTIKEWRTPNSVSLRLYGRGEVFYAYVEYATGRWRAGGDSPRSFPTITDPSTKRVRLRGFQGGAAHEWSLRYDPAGNDGHGSVTATIGEATAVCHLERGHKADGATFDRFGLLTVMKHADAGGELWIDDLTINGETEDFSRDPRWEGFQNRRTYTTRDVRPRFDFGFSRTRHAQGSAAGELGGLIFRGDHRYPERMAYYADRLDRLTLEKPLRAAGKIALLRGVSDSTTLLGFFDSASSVAVGPSQDSGFPKSFVGIAVEGPSREGFFVYPVYREGGRGDRRGSATGGGRPRIDPDGKAHDWTLAYDPATAARPGRLTAALDGKSVSIDLDEAIDKTATRFDRFGCITTWVDGNGQRVYFDDLRYTCKQEED